MKPINIYSLTRIEDLRLIAAYERQHSKRSYFLDVKDREIDGLKKLSEHLAKGIDAGHRLEFYYSFQIPKLGKEFDLLRISDESIVNIELKSGNISNKRIKGQLEQNRYYLASLGINIRSYTFVSDEDKLYRLTSGGNLVETDFDKLCTDLMGQVNCYSDDIEKLFKEEHFLVSPLTDPERFLLGEYFLTAQQIDIKKNILEGIKEKKSLYHGFWGLPGTGKTLLLYDLAMKLSVKQRVCVLHFGSFPDELRYLDNRLKRIDFFHIVDNDIKVNLDDYSAIMIDEGHRMGEDIFEKVMRYASSRELPVIISFDKEDALEERERPVSFLNNPSFGKAIRTFKLTNRIRLNSELSNFIHILVNARYKNRKSQYPLVSISYGSTLLDLLRLLDYYKSLGYVYIRDNDLYTAKADIGLEITADEATCREFDKVLMVIDANVKYNEEGYLVSAHDLKGREKNSCVRRLFHGLNRAKSNIALIIYDNKGVFEVLLGALQKNNN